MVGSHLVSLGSNQKMTILELCPSSDLSCHLYVVSSNDYNKQKLLSLFYTLIGPSVFNSVGRSVIGPVSCCSLQGSLQIPIRLVWQVEARNGKYTLVTNKQKQKQKNQQYTLRLFYTLIGPSVFNSVGRSVIGPVSCCSLFRLLS